MIKKRETQTLFTQSGKLAVALAVFCIFALLGTAAEVTTEQNHPNGNKIIQFTDSPVRVLLQGNLTYQVSLDGKKYSRPMPQSRHIRIRGHQFDPLVNAPINSPSAAKSKAPGTVSLYIVQCLTQPLEVYQNRITAAGAEISAYLHDNALVAAMTPTVKAEIEKMSFVRWVGDYRISFKLEPELNKELSQSTSAGDVRYSIWMSKKNKRKEVVDFIEQIGGEVVLKTKGRRLEAMLNTAQLNQVAALPQVLYLDRWTPIEDDMDIVRAVSGANYLESVQGYTGQGVRAEVCDGGLRTTHDDYQSNPPLIHAANSSSTSHGTSVYGIVFGDGTVDATGRGMIPDAQQPIFAAYDSFTDRYAHTEELVNPAGPYRAVFQTNSWGNSLTTAYTTISAEMDEIIFDLDIIILQSQSNAGNRSSRPQAWAKNILSVGGIRHYNTQSRTDDCWCSSASIGPADDGRIKPDLWHFYDYTWSPYYTSDTAYSNFGGTSGATPITAGHMGLLFQMWGDGVFSGGPGQNRDVFNTRPHASTAKALLIHTAYQYTFSGSTDDKTRVHQGWGMADVQNLYQSAQGAGWGFPILIDESALLAPLQTHAYNINVSGAGPLRATMVYADPAGVPNSSVNRINDLSLRVTSPSGTVYWGNNGLLTSNWSTSGGSSNTIDTVENVFIQNPEAGNWTIEVLGDEIVQDGHVETPALDADYALIVSGGDSAPVEPPAAPSGLSAVATSCDQIDLAWTDNSNNESSFVIERGTNGVNFTPIASVGADVAAYNDTTVAENTTYYYRVKASNSGGESSYTNTANALTPTCPANPPAAPSNLGAKAKGKAKIVLTWNDNSTNESGFRIYRGLSAGSLTLLTTVSANTTTYEDTTVASKTTYYYKTCAYNNDGEACSATASAGTK